MSRPLLPVAAVLLATGLGTLGACSSAIRLYPRTMEAPVERRPLVRPRRPLDANGGRTLGRRGDVPEAGRPRMAFDWCPRLPRWRRHKPRILLVGSSTMAGTLGPMMRRVMRRWPLHVTLFGRSSSGLARPDFFDWPTELVSWVKEVNPDVIVISLGTNDFQALRTLPSEQRRLRRKWIRTDDPRWEALYARRVDRLLRVAAGPGKRRTVLYMGPTPFDSHSARTVGPRLNDLVRRRVEAFGGQAVYVDVWEPIMGSDGHPRDKLRLPGGGETDMFGHDGIHLSVEAMEHVLAARVYRLLWPCLGAPKRGRLPRRDRESEAAIERERRPPAGRRR